jgi:hypothetical protein
LEVVVSGGPLTADAGETQRQARAAGPWKDSFDIDGVAGGEIKLHQVDRKTFALKSKIYYRGATGLNDEELGPDVVEDIRTLEPGPDPNDVHTTDLASVPGPLRWFLGTYGAHTPAVLIHDRLIPTPAGLKGMTDQYADRYLRFMLQDIGMRWLKRWVMWSGVAMRTRWAAGGVKRLSVLVWVITALAGMTVFAIAAANGSVGWMIAAGLAPLVSAGLWDKQYGAGIVASIAAPWLLPPTILAVLGLVVYVVLEFVLGWVWGLFAGSDRRGSGTYRPDGV